MNICLYKMTESLIKQFFNGFQYDPDTFQEQDNAATYVYNAERALQYFQKQKQLGRIHFAIIQSDKVVGELLLKDIDHDAGCCTLSIHLKDDSVKNQGIGTAAETLALQYAFSECKMKAVYADALIKNVRSRHVLEKVGFKEINRDARFCYYVCEKPIDSSQNIP